MKRLKNPFVVMGLLVLFTHTANAQWVQTNGPGPNGGAIWPLAVNGNSIFAGTERGGVFLSINNGASWAAVDSGLPSYIGVWSLAVSGSNIFAGTQGMAGVYLSTNNGTSWTAAGSGITYPYVYPLGASSGNVFAGADGLYLSTNNGASWTLVDSLGASCFAVSGGNIFAGTGYGVSLSTNNGTSWTLVDSFLPASSYVSALAVIGGNIFAGASGRLDIEDQDETIIWGVGVFLSSNNGRSWTAVNSGLTDTVVTSLAVSGSNIFAGTDSGVFLSTNNGTSWHAVNSGLVTGITSLVVSDRYIFAAVGGLPGAIGEVWRRPLSEMVGVINPDLHQGMLKPYANGFKININKNGIALILPETLNNGAITIGLFNVAGRRIYSATHQARNGILNIPVSGLSTGTYLMSITGSNTVLRSSFVVTK